MKDVTSDAQEIHFGEEAVLTGSEVSTAIKALKSGKAAGEDEIRPEMLKALNREGVCVSVCQVCVSSRMDIW